MQIFSDRRPTLLLVLVAFSLFLFFFRLGDRHLWDSDETRIVEVTREMMASGDYLVPQLNGEPLPTKPLLYHWLIAFFARPLGLTPFSARLPAALLAIGGIVITFLVGESILGPVPAFLSGLILATSSTYWWLARFARPDMALAFFILVSLFSFQRAISGASPRYYLLFYTSMALGTLAKGPVAVIVPALVVVVYLMLVREPGRLREMRLLQGAIIYLAITVPWYLAVTMQAGPDFLKEFFEIENVGRFLGQGRFARSQPFWFYVPVFFADFFPWSVFFPFAVGVSLATRESEKLRSMLFILAWFGVIFLFFSASRFKLPRYILVLYPAAALLVGHFWYLCSQAKEDQLALRSLFFSCLALSAILTVGALGTPLYVLKKFPQYIWPAMGAAFFLLALATLLVLWARSQRAVAVFAAVCSATVFFLIVYTVAILPKIEPRRTAWPFMQKVISLVAPQDELKSYGVWKPAFPYYSKRFVPLLSSEQQLLDVANGPRRAFIISDAKAFERLPEGVRSAFSIVMQGSLEHGHPVLLIRNQPGEPILSSHGTRKLTPP